MVRRQCAPITPEGNHLDLNFLARASRCARSHCQLITLSLTCPPQEAKRYGIDRGMTASPWMADLVSSTLPLLHGPPSFLPPPTPLARFEPARSRPLFLPPSNACTAAPLLNAPSYHIASHSSLSRTLA